MRLLLCLAFCAAFLPLSALAAKSRECSDQPVIVGKLQLYKICHCETSDYAKLTEYLNGEGVRIARKQAVWKNEKGLAKCSVTLAWVNPKERYARSRCNDENVNRIVAQTLGIDQDLAVNSKPLRCLIY